MREKGEHLRIMTAKVTPRQKALAVRAAMGRPPGCREITPGLDSEANDQKQ